MTANLYNHIPSADVVLIGAGLSHIEFIRSFKNEKIRKFRLTLISSTPRVVYTEAFPLLVSKEKQENDCYIDLGHLCQEAGIRFICDTAVELLPDQQQVILKQSERKIPYDLVSINIGAVSNKKLTEIIPEQQSVRTRPVTKFLRQLESIEQSVDQLQKGEIFNLAINGANLESIELALALARRFKKDSRTFEKIRISLITNEAAIATSQQSTVSKRLNYALRSCGIQTVTSFSPASFNSQTSEIIDQDGRTLKCDRIIFSKTSVAPDWIKNSSLDTDENGFITIQKNLESTSHPGVYATGNIATLKGQEHSSSLNAIETHMGKILAKNLIRRFSGTVELEINANYHPLSIVELNQHSAIALKGSLYWQSKKMKQHKVKRLNRWLKSSHPKASRVLVPTFIESGNLNHRPCAGAGAKLPQGILQKLFHQQKLNQELKKTQQQSNQQPDLEVSLSGEELQKGFLQSHQNKAEYQQLQTISYLRPFTQDLNLFAKIAATHAFNDLYACGVAPQSAQVIANIPHGTKQTMERDFNDVLNGVDTSLAKEGVKLSGISGQMGEQPGIGITAQAFKQNQTENPWLNNTSKIGDALIMTKPLGTGILFTGSKDYVVGSQHLYQAAEEMITSHAPLLDIAKNFETHHITNIAGYGLANAVKELAYEKNLLTTLRLEKIPIYNGVLKALAAGVRSSLHGQNRMAFTKSLQGLSSRELLLTEVLFDPQTAGPLLISLPQSQAEDFIHQLKSAGFSQAAIIGNLQALDETQAKLLFFQN